MAIILGTENLTERPLLAYYPASQVTGWSGNNVTISLPQVQEYRESNGHQIIDNPMAAYCPEGSDELKFRNLGALLKVTIDAPQDLNLKAIVVKGNDNQMLWGTTRLTLDNQDRPMLHLISNGGASVFLHFETPASISANTSKSFYIVVPAGSNFLDFKIIIFTDKGEFQKETPLGQSLPRNHIGALAYTPANGDKINAILYTGSIEGFRSDAFGGANVVSFTDGVILFDRSLSTIGDYAFQFCSGLTTITLPTSLESIGEGAFYECSNLASITLPDNLTSIETETFGNCGSLTSINLPSSLTSIGNSAFFLCTRLTHITLPANLESIGGNAFQYCSSLTSITLPTSLESIGESAFYECSNLTSITLPDEVTSIGEKAFYGCSSLTSISLPANLTTIGDNAFEECSDLRSVVLPKNLSSIGGYMFANCTSLSSIVWPENLNSIADYAFGYCSGLESIDIPAGVTSIGESAFDGCINLASISLPASLESIGDWVFSGCGSLAQVDCYAINPPTLGANALTGIPSSAVLHVPSNAGDYSSWSEYFGGGIVDDL